MIAVLLGLLVACTGDDDVVYDQFNGEADTVAVEVGAPDILDDVVVDLTSSTGGVVIGEGRVSPGGGPIGTEHEIRAEIFDEWEGTVDRVSIRADAGDRGVDEYDLTQDSADEGLYRIVIVSVGDEGETRTDTLTFRAWDEIEEEEVEE